MSEVNSKNIKRLMPCLLILFILANLMVQAFVTVSPAIAQDFDISASMVSMVVTMSTIVLGVCSVIYGALSDYIPVKKLLVFGIGMFILGTLIGLIFQKIFVMIVIARAVQTIGQAAMSSLYLVIASRYLEGNEKVRYFAYFTASFQIAQALGVLAGGIIATYISWEMLFVISLVAIFFAPAVIRYAPVEDTMGERKKIDFIGLLLFSALIVVMTLLLNKMSLNLLLAEIIIVVIFLLYIAKNENAFITPRFFSENKKYTKAILTVFAVYLCQFVFAFLYTFIVNGMYENSLDLVSYILLPGYIMAAFVGGIGDKIVHRLGRYKTVVIGIIMIIAGLLMTAFFMDQGKLVLSFSAILFFVGYNTLYSPMLDSVIGTLPEQELGRGIGLNDLTINISSSFGVAIGGRLMVTAALNKVQFLPVNASLNIYGNIMLIFAAIAFISLLLFIKHMKGFYQE